MYFWINSTPETKCWIAFAAFCAIVFAFLGIMAIIEAIDERRERRAEERRRACKRYNMPIRPARRY